MKKIIYTRPDGGLSVVHPVINTHPVRENITEEEALQRAFAKLSSDAINPQIVEANVIPTDRTFRDAWSHGGDKVVHDMPKCREIWKDKLREIRAPILAVLDVEYLLADEKSDTILKGQIAIKKQALRDVTADPRIERSQTPEELKAVIPNVLDNKHVSKP